MTDRTIDLRAYGYAPGSYMIRCVDCPRDSTIPLWERPSADKRAWRCEPHARAAWLAQNDLPLCQKAPAELIRQVTELVNKTIASGDQSAMVALDNFIEIATSIK